MPGMYRQLGPREEHEFSRFLREWPWTAAKIAEAIGIDIPAPRATRFDVGTVFYPTVDCVSPTSNSLGDDRMFPSGVRVQLHDLVDDHAAGSFGVYGRYDDESCAENAILAANKAAIASRAGAVRSRFMLHSLKGYSIREAFGDPSGVAVDVVTVWSERRPRTLVTRERVEASHR